MESLSEQIGSAATLLSISLGVLSAFANQRAASVAEQEVDLEPLEKDGVTRDFALDVALALFGVLLLAAGGALFCAALGRATPLFQADTAFFALFCLVYVGIAVVVAWAGDTARRRWIVRGELS